MSRTNKISLIVLAVSLITIINSIIVIMNSAEEPKRIDHNLPNSNLSDKNWRAILGHQTSIDEFKILNTGSVKVPLDGMLNTDKLSKTAKLEEYLWVDVFVFLFHHQDRGWHIIDTGLDSTFCKDGNIRGLLASNYIIQSRQKPNQNIAAQLQEEDKDIKGIFFTHLHGDHTAGMPEIDRTIPKYIGKGDEYLDLPYLYQTNHLTDNSVLHEMDWSKGISKKPFDHVIDIFGDGSILGIHTPGHSKGHLSYLLNTTAGSILLTGDASHTKYGFDNNIEPGWVDDQEAAENSLSQLRRFHEMFPEIQVIYGHEHTNSDLAAAPEFK